MKSTGPLVVDNSNAGRFVSSSGNIFNFASFFCDRRIWRSRDVFLPGKEQDLKPVLCDGRKKAGGSSPCDGQSPVSCITVRAHERHREAQETAPSFSAVVVVRNDVILNADCGNLSSRAFLMLVLYSK
jgi:hypothetical protein